MRLLVLFCLSVFFFDLSLVSRRFTSPQNGLTYIPASRTVEAARLVFTESGRSPVSGSVGHVERKVSLHSFSLVPNSHMSKAQEDKLKAFSQAGGEKIQIVKKTV